jgi:hypothetical protein
MEGLAIVEKDVEHVRNNQKIHAEKIRSLEIKIDEVDHKFDKRFAEYEVGRLYDREKLNAIDSKLQDMSKQLTQINNRIISNESIKKEKTKSFENFKWVGAVIVATGIFDVFFHVLGWK